MIFLRRGDLSGIISVGACFCLNQGSMSLRLCICGKERIILLVPGLRAMGDIGYGDISHRYIVTCLSHPVLCNKQCQHLVV